MGDQRVTTADGGAAPHAPSQRRLQLPAEPASVAPLRNEARAFARAHGAVGHLPADVALAVTEAATNAVLHAFVGREPGTLTLVCSAGRDRLRFRVIDDGRGMQPRPDSPGMGIGLSTIAKVASGMDVSAGDDGTGTEIAMTFDAPGVRGPYATPADAREAALLDAASRLAQSAAWPQEGVERLADLLVGELGDAVTVDVVDDGVLRRLSARVSGDPALSAWLADSLPPMKPGTATWDALNGRSPSLVVHDPRQPRTAGGPGERLGLDWWVACALPDRNGRPLGLVGLGGRDGRPAPGDAAVALIAEVAERAAGGLAQARVVDDLRATRRRLEGILAALTEAVTVSTADGRIVWANDAAARMLDRTSAADLIAAPAGEVVSAYAMTGEDGAPISGDAMPARRLLRGEDAPPVVVRSVHRPTGRIRWVRTSAQLLDAGVGEPLAVNIIEDITDAHQAALRRDALEAAGRLLDGPEPARAETLQAVCALVAPVAADRCAIDLAGDGGALARAAVWPEGAQVAARPVDEPCLERTAVRVPLTGGGTVHGVLTLVSAESDRAFDEGDRAFAADLGRRIGLAVAYEAGAG